MLAICDKFATEYSVMFNNTKSKCITFNYSKAGRDASAPLLPSFAIGGNEIENVDRCPHLGHVFTVHLTDDDDILARSNSIISDVFALSFLTSSHVSLARFLTVGARRHFR